MINTRALLASALAAAAAFAVATSVPAQNAPSGPPIKIGLIAEQTGALGFLGSETVRAAILVVKQINDGGGLVGRPVELLVRDSKTTVNEAVRQARDLLFTENVDFLLHSINSAECVAVGNVAQQAKKVLFSDCTNDAFTSKDFNHYVFRIPNATTRTQGFAAADYIKAHLLARGNRYYTIAHDFAFGRNAVAAFKERIKAVNPAAEFVGEGWPKIDEADYAPFITAMDQAKPDVVFFAWAIGIPFWQQAAPFKPYQKFAMVSSYWSGSDEMQVLPKDAVPSGVILGGFPWYAIKGAENETFVKEFRAAYQRAPMTPAYMLYISMQALRAAVAKAKSVETEAVIAALEGLQYDSVVGPVTIRPFDHQGTTPHWTGTAAWDAERNMGVLTNIIQLPTSEYLPSEQELKRLRNP
ncbi:MAG: ABC transporter substrate-binding protein [Xanthobacteraceae bacterium]